MPKRASKVKAAKGDDPPSKKVKLQPKGKATKTKTVAASSQEPVTVSAAPSKTSKGTFSLVSHLQDPEWKRHLTSEFEADYFRQIESFLDGEYKKKKEIFPPQNQIFNAFNLTPLSQVKAVILGQDPYHDVGQAHGLCFSVQKGIPPPPSLKNIYKELVTDIPGFITPDHGFLEKWAKQGVLLLNATLTVEAHKANSHAKIGWQKFTDKAIRTVSEACTGVVFLLWGGFAHKKMNLIDEEKHHIIATAHPSPLSVTYFRGCRCFSKANDALKSSGKAALDWSL